MLADCPDILNLTYLDVDRNGLTSFGINALRRVLGTRVRADDQQTEGELAEREYLNEGEFE